MRAYEGQNWFTLLYLAFSSGEARILPINALTNVILIPGLTFPEHPLKCQQAYVVGGLNQGKKYFLFAVTTSCTTDVVFSPQYVWQVFPGLYLL